MWGKGKIKQMSKESIKEEIDDFKRRGGEFCFSFGDVRMPVEYDEAQGVASVDVPGYKASISVDYDKDMCDNLDVLMDKLLDKYPELTR